MGHRDGIFAVLALAVSSLALAGMVYTDDYSRAAQAEANGFNALTQQVFEAGAAGSLALCDNGGVAADSAARTVQK